MFPPCLIQALLSTQCSDNKSFLACLCLSNFVMPLTAPNITNNTITGLNGNILSFDSPLQSTSHLAIIFLLANHAYLMFLHYFLDVNHTDTDHGMLLTHVTMLRSMCVRISMVCSVGMVQHQCRGSLSHWTLTSQCHNHNINRWPLSCVWPYQILDTRHRGPLSEKDF